ncbi:arylamine N-acetyltransferase family protein [Celerinatantimonas sp. YJH-8]|uniref:arylamine N-acetyltransferase family protein n=1 Tax=Celerinatantimonas sp. YJH-8 TaxID=3228714 RepID=UPI0038C8B49F
MIFDAYLNELGLEAPTQPDFDFLSRYIARHMELFTFNNLSVLLKEDISLDMDTLLSKVVRRKSGGYCFEHNKLAYELLNSLGYSVRLVVGKVLNNFVRPVPRTHRITLVEIDGKSYLVDVGFGANCPITPIALNHPQPQLSGLDHYQIHVLENGEYDLVRYDHGQPFILYRFDLAHYTEADCEMAHFYSHKHPNAVFTKNMVVSQKNKNEVKAIVNQEFTHRTANGEVTQLIPSGAVLFELLTDQFALSVDREVCDFIFERTILPKLT